MSARVLAWAWEQDLPAGEKVVLLAICDQARNDGVLPYGPQAELAAMSGAKERTVRSTLAKLEERGLIKRVAQYEEGWRVPDLIMVAVGGSLGLPADFAATGKIGRTLPSSTTKTSNSVGGEGRKRQDLPVFVGDVPAAMREDAVAYLGRKEKVGGRVVTSHEIVVVAAVVAEFNRQSGSECGVAAHATAIVGRIRERPAYDVETHVRLVQSAWRIRWWERSGKGRRPTPAVIYGNAGVFEQVIQDAVDEKAGREQQAPAKRFTRED